MSTMKTLAAVIAVSLLSVSAFAAQSHIGVVKSLSATEIVVGGKTFAINDKTAVEPGADIKAGVRVAVASEDGKTATSVISAPAAAATLVESHKVCMINNRSMAMDQIPVEIEGKTYFGCCPMCKERLAKDAAARWAVDPVSGNKVDKAKAVIGALPGAAVLYFESAANLQKYNASATAK
jgi:YHS domain-containing protein